MKTEIDAISQGVILRPGHTQVAHMMLDGVVSFPEQAADGLVRVCEAGPAVTLPDNYLGESNVTLPSQYIETFRGNRALLLPLYATNPNMAELYEQATRGNSRANKMPYEIAVRMLDTVGVNGLHHIHKTSSRMPKTVYYNVVRRSKSGAFQTYVTEIGKGHYDQSVLPLLAVIGATNGAKQERIFHSYVGERRRSARN